MEAHEGFDIGNGSVPKNLCLVRSFSPPHLIYYRPVRGRRVLQGGRTADVLWALFSFAFSASVFLAEHIRGHSPGNWKQYF